MDDSQLAILAAYLGATLRGEDMRAPGVAEVHVATARVFVARARAESAKPLPAEVGAELEMLP
jgi:hypothetical protein